MSSGSSTYRILKEKVQEVEQDYAALGSEVKRYEKNISELVQERGRKIVQLAKIYLPEMDATSVKNTDDELQGEMQRLYRQKQEHVKRLEEQITLAQQNRQIYESRGEETSEQLNKTSAAIDKVEKAVAQELQGDEKYVQLHQQASQAEQRLQQNKQRQETFTQEAKEKMSAYLGNPLFAYLIKNNFGTSAYYGGGVTKRLDTWVGGLVSFAKQRQNYDFLNFMPGAIKAEVDQQQQEVDWLVDKLEKIEDLAEQKHGLPPLMQEGQKLAEKRDVCLAEIKRIDSTVSQYQAEQQKLESAEDTYLQQGLAKYKQFLEGQTIAELKERARETPSPEDDNLVTALEQIDGKMEDLQDKVKRTHSTQKEVSAKLEGLREVQRQYTSNDFEAERSYFTSGFDFDSLLVGYMAGKMSHGDFFGSIKQHQRFKPRETYTSYSSSSYSSSSHRSSGSSSSVSRSFSSGFSSGSRSIGGGGFRSGGKGF